MQAIRTTKLAPTDHRGARIKATAAAGSLAVSYDHALGWAANHVHAAQLLRVKFGWNAVGYGTLVSGCLSDGSFCHVMTGPQWQGGQLKWQR